MIATDKYTGLSAEQARELLAYDPETGLLTWKVSGHGRMVGMRAGYLVRGYTKVRVNYRAFFKHRLAWLIYYGEWPNDMLDHIDGDQGNDRITNLRQATASMNSQNLHSPHARSKTGVLGVCRERGKYRASIKSAGKNLRIGRYETLEEARDAYLKARRELHEGNTL